MKYELGRINISSVQFAGNTAIREGILFINKDEMIAHICKDIRITDLDVHLARPGDSIRIMPVKDVIEPRVKLDGLETMFPGMAGKMAMAGYGKTNVLSGCAVVTTGKIIGFQEGIIDMSGIGADYTPFSQTINIVLDVEVAPDLEKHQHEEILRIAGLKAACYLGEAGRDIKPDILEAYERRSLPEMLSDYPGLPKVAYVYMLQSQGLLHDTYVYGVDAKRTLPTLLHPLEVFDGAIVSGNCVSACDKNTTYHHLNNPVIEDLLKIHGSEVNFLGVLITNENVTLADKQRSSSFTAKLAEQLGLDGVIISEEGFGNPDTDLIMNCKKISEKGIKTVVIADEYAGRDGASQSLADADPTADAFVSSGNANATVTLLPMEKVIGYFDTGELIAGGFKGGLASDGSLTVEIQAITGATNELGFNKLSAMEV